MKFKNKKRYKSSTPVLKNRTGMGGVQEYGKLARVLWVNLAHLAGYEKERYLTLKQKETKNKILHKHEEIMKKVHDQRQES